jgi:tetratricopeptide (TPR) repeat protein
MDARAHYSTRDAARILQTTEPEVRTWAKMGGVVPERGSGPDAEFTFQQLLLLRTTRGLLQAGIPARRVRRIWSSLRRQLDGDLPLTSIRIYADGDRAVAWDGNAPWQPDSGQFLLDFEGGELAQRADVDLVVLHGGATEVATPKAERAKEAAPPKPAKPAIATPPPSRGRAAALPPKEIGPPALSAEQWFRLGCELEGASPLEARQAYMQALEVDPDYADVHLNLGRLDHEAGNLGAAEARYRRAVECDPEDATAHYNLGVLLEDRDRPDEAILAYRQAIARDPEAADAHYNLGLLLESMGRRSEAMRHLMVARRLYAP